MDTGSGERITNLPRPSRQTGYLQSQAFSFNAI